ncbi:hypothetical protein B0H15DRAFT_803566 [Mycena belliarum]|uniref:Uncharacterized protein n=1 Tax=Mycena belliarum TaxID=1033014 RepID=A0AAD6XKR9_9AGAR|nr:hypothetical protein B0H15DRAFT_803566 [Mycena belliae]
MRHQPPEPFVKVSPGARTRRCPAHPRRRLQPSPSDIGIIGIVSGVRTGLALVHQPRRRPRAEAFRDDLNLLRPFNPIYTIHLRSQVVQFGSRTEALSLRTCLLFNLAAPTASSACWRAGAINSRHYAFPTATTDLPVRSQDTVTMLDLNRFALHSLTSVPLDAVTMLERLQLTSQFVLEGRSYAYYDSTDPKRPPLPCLNEYKASADNLKTLLLCLINSSARTRAVTILYFTYLD